MPSNGQHSFLPKEIGKLVIEDNVSMPSNGQHSFLLEFVQNKTPEICMCQCPQTGHTHFYGALEFFDEDKAETCQCPQTGRTHFYKYGSNVAKVSGVNALKRATLISTVTAESLSTSSTKRVNALKRATLISTSRR